MKTIKKLFPLILLLVIESAIGQENDFKIIYEKENCAKKSELVLTPLFGTFKPVEYNDSYNPSLSSFSSAETDGGIFDKALEIEKQKVTKEKKEFQSSEPLENQSNKKTEINTISIRQKFEAGITASCPPDNTIAISKDGKIFSGSNSGVRIYTESGLLLKSWTLLNFVNNSDLKNLCDPKVIYDDIEDRFVFYTQTCDWPKPSSVVVAFSKTNDPAGDWWVYTLTGDPGGNLVVFDYPKMAITAHEILITGNLFTSSGTTFDESVIYQINKHDGYDGKTLNWQFWNGIEGAPFTILPLRNGLGGNYGNVCHFVSMKSSTGNSINVYTLTDQMSAPNEVLNLKKITITNYTVMGNSSQSGTSTKLHTGDCRVLDGYFQNPIIHFVNTVSGSGWGVVRYYRYNFNTLEGSFKTISDIG